MKNHVVASLEVSTSSAKCILFSESEGVIAQFSEAYPADVATGPSQDPDGIVAAALGVLHRAAQEADTRGIRVSAVGLTGTWHSLLLLDSERKPLGSIMTWADVSGAPTVAPMRGDDSLVKSFYRATGCMVHAMYPVWKWIHLRLTQPEYVSRVSFLSSQIEYLFERLTGCQGVSRCTASGTGLLNIHTLDWDDDVLGMAGIRREQLSPLQEAYRTAPLLPETAQAVGLLSGLPVTVGCADGAMNQMGIGGVQPGTMSMSVGTSGALRAVHDEPRIPAKPSTWCYYLLEGKRLAGAAVNNATNCVDWFLSRAGAKARDTSVYEKFSAETNRVDVDRAPFFMPFLFGERCPGWRENRAGGFVGVRAAHDEFDLYHAVLEGVLFSMRQCYEILVEVGGRPERVIMSGGITNSREWSQMAADVFGRELLTTGVSNDSTVGAALVAMQAVTGGGHAENYSPEITRSLKPHESACNVYERRYKRYLEYYLRSASDE